MIALDRLRAELTALERALRELKNHYREGMVVEEDYNQAMKDLLEKMGHIQHKITERKSPSTAMNTQPMKEKKPKAKTVAQQPKKRKNSRTLESIAKEARESRKRKK